MMNPSPCLLTILLAMKPAIRPKMIQPMMDMPCAVLPRRHANADGNIAKFRECRMKLRPAVVQTLKRNSSTSPSRTT